MTTALEFEVIAEHPLRIGENPLWNDEEERLYYVGLYEGRLYRYDPGADQVELVYDGDETLGAFTFQADGSLLLFLDRGTVRVWREGSGIENTLAAPGELTEARFNDVVTDPEGRVFCGSRHSDDIPGHLFRLDTDASFERVHEDVKLSNGLGFSPDLETLYYAESHAWTIHAFDYDRASGGLSNARQFVKFEDEGPLPDGLTVDADGDLWVAMADGGELARFAPDGTERARYDTPVGFPTSVAFGGSALSDLFVTTGMGDDREQYGNLAGATFRCRPGVTGRQPYRSRVGLE